AWLNGNPTVTVRIEGHADERGTREYNLALGERRANAVREYLMSQGVSGGRIATISYGKERPAAVGTSEEAYAQNRRSVTVLVSGYRN
ncbi:MAG: OmpA family protein, partial [Alphaproteobacteria bacterium]